MIDVEDIHDAVRRTRRTLHLVVGLYVAIGLLVSCVGALSGDRLSTFLGFMIVGGALGAAAIFNILFRTVSSIGTQDRSAAEMRSSLARIEGVLEEIRSSRREEDVDRVRMINLASVGGGDPGAITAATLDRSDFPRLVTAIGKEHHSTSDADRPDRTDWDSMTERRAPEAQSVESPVLREVHGKDLWRTWSAAMRDGNLLACRSAYAALVDSAEPQAVADMARALEALALRHESRLRRTFAARVQAKQFGEALALGAEIFSLFGDHPLSDEFERLRPILERRVSSTIGDRNFRSAAST